MYVYKRISRFSQGASPQRHFIIFNFRFTLSYNISPGISNASSQSRRISMLPILSNEVYRDTCSVLRERVQSGLPWVIRYLDIVNPKWRFRACGKAELAPENVKAILVSYRAVFLKCWRSFSPRMQFLPFTVGCKENKERVNPSARYSKRFHIPDSLFLSLYFSLCIKLDKQDLRDSGFVHFSARGTMKSRLKELQQSGGTKRLVLSVSRVSHPDGMLNLAAAVFLMYAVVARFNYLFPL